MRVGTDGVISGLGTLLPAGGAATDGLSLVAYDALAPVEALWRAFEPTAVRTVFQSFDWLSVWQATVGAPRAVTPAIVVARDAAIASRMTC